MDKRVALKFIQFILEDNPDLFDDVLEQCQHYDDFKGSTHSLAAEVISLQDDIDERLKKYREGNK